MLKTIIFDADADSRAGLSEKIRWSAYNARLVGTAENASEAIELITRFSPDICIVDIENRGGASFLREALMIRPQMQIVVLTALNDFETARLCVRLHVFDYIMKPAQPGELNDVIMRISRFTEPGSRAEVPSDLPEPTAIEQIVRYIEQNYADPHINLTSVAQHFGFSSSYLSRKFKQDTGKRFIEFLTECRMEQAMLMASEHEKMFVAAGAVGIPDPNYFGRCFKKYTGVSYSEYVNTGEQT